MTSNICLNIVGNQFRLQPAGKQTATEKQQPPTSYLKPTASRTHIIEWTKGWEVGRCNGLSTYCRAISAAQLFIRGNFLFLLHEQGTWRGHIQWNRVPWIVDALEKDSIGRASTCLYCLASLNEGAKQVARTAKRGKLASNFSVGTKVLIYL